jgi:hypothetical protein
LTSSASSASPPGRFTCGGHRPTLPEGAPHQHGIDPAGVETRSPTDLFEAHASIKGLRGRVVAADLEVDLAYARLAFERPFQQGTPGTATAKWSRDGERENLDLREDPVDDHEADGLSVLPSKPDAGLGA